MAPPFVAPQFAQQPAPVPTFARPFQPYAAPAPQQTAARPAPRFRAQMPEEPVSNELPVPPARPAPLTMPSPEQLGVAPARTDAVFDWTTAHRRLDLLGASSYRERLAQGGYRFTCLLPTTQADRVHRVEAVAATEEEAVRLALQKAEEWAAGGERR